MTTNALPNPTDRRTWMRHLRFSFSLSKRDRFILIMVILPLGVLFVSMIHLIPPASMTVTRMETVRHRILLAVQKGAPVPHDLSQLPRREGFDDSVSDGWGRRFICRIGADEEVLLISYGKDGLPGGTRDDRDLWGTFSIRSPEAKSNARGPAWNIAPTLHGP